MSIEFSPSARRVVTEGRVARLATADRAGRPLVVPICYAFDGQHCYSVIDKKPKRASGERLRRVQNIRENPNVSLLIDHYEEDWARLSYVIIEGHAEILSGGHEFSAGIDLLLGKYLQYQKMPLDRQAGIMIKMTPHRVIEWRATPVGGFE